MLLSLDDPRSTLCEWAGGKGAALARLSQAGFRVPQAYVVSPDEWVIYFATPPLAEAVTRLLEADEPDRGGHYSALRQLARLTPLPQSLVRDAEKILRSVGPLMACRSSAVIEDGETRSFAGMLSSYLGLSATIRDFTVAVKAVWLSMLHPRVLAYLQAANEDDRLDAIHRGCAVLVQQFIRAETSGVLFHGPEHTRIEAVYGLGPALVSGKVSPDIFERRGGQWSQSLESYKRAALVAAEEGWKDLLPGDIVQACGFPAHFVKSEGHLALIRPASPADRVPVLSQEKCEELAALSDAISRCLDLQDLDLEWAWQSEVLHVLQARPITVALTTSDTSVGEHLGASPGIAEGVAWSPSQNSVPPDVPFVLLVQEITPDMLPFVVRASGVVAQIGGVLSHGAIVCRELAKPLVILRDQRISKPLAGSYVHIDGTAGQVRVS